MFDINIMDRLIRLPGIVIALVAISYGEALMAYLMGDDTPKNMGRLTISPAAHLDPIGFLIMFLVGFGWSKPVYVNDNNFKNKQLGRALFFLSGTIMNLIVAIIFGWIIIILNKINIGSNELFMVLSSIIVVNISLASFRLLPIPPLAGFYFILEIVPYNIKIKLRELERFSMVFILLIIYTGLVGFIIEPIITTLYAIFNIFTLGLF